MFLPEFCVRFAKRGEVNNFFLRSIFKIILLNDHCRQVNVDYSVCNALIMNFNSHELPEALVIYDVMCQYFVNFKHRLRDVSDYLELDPEMKVDSTGRVTR